MFKRSSVLPRGDWNWILSVFIKSLYLTSRGADWTEGIPNMSHLSFKLFWLRIQHFQLCLAQPKSAGWASPGRVWSWQLSPTGSVSVWDQPCWRVWDVNRNKPQLWCFLLKKFGVLGWIFHVSLSKHCKPGCSSIPGTKQGKRGFWILVSL